MKKTAGFFSLCIALILLIGSFLAWKSDVDDTAGTISQGFRDIHNDVAFSRDLQDEKDRQNSYEIRAVLGAGFLIVGLVLLAKKPNVIPIPMDGS